MTERKKIGIVLNNVSFRSDIRLFIKELSKSYKVILFGSLKDCELVACQDCEFREVAEVSNPISRFYNKILRKIYFYIGNLPKTKDAYNDYQVRLIHKAYDKNTLRKALKRQKIKMILPHFFSFDKYLSLLISGKSNIYDVDVFIAYTDLNNDNLLSQVVKKKKKLIGYVHSWDHIPKFTRFLKNKITYITWNNHIKNDLVDIHNIDECKISILGASQFYFIKDYFSNSFECVEVKEKYIYFPCSFGYPKVAKQEVEIIEFVSKMLLDMDSHVKLVVRPYPMLKSWDIYKPLEELQNVFFDDFKQSEELYMDKTDHLYKCEMIEDAMAVLHTGTTIGLEASYFDTPVVYLNIEDIDYGISLSDESHIFYSWNQYHLKKYYFLPEYPSVIKNKIEMQKILEMLILDQETDLMTYNRQLRSYSPLSNIYEFTSAFKKLLY